VVAAAAVAATAFWIGGGEKEPGPYVDGASLGGTCSDSRTAEQAMSPETPWCGLERAAELAEDGSTVTVREARYPKLAITGRAREKALAFEPLAAEQPVLDGLEITRSAGFRFGGFRITDQAVLDHVARVGLVGNDISPHGVQVEGGRELLFEDNEIHDLTMEIDPATGRCVPPRCGYGFRIVNGSGLTFRGNRFSRIPADGIQSGTAEDYLIQGNEFERISAFVDPLEHSDSLQFYRGSNGVQIRGNYFHQTRGPLLGPSSGAEESHNGLVVANNTIVRQTDWGLKVHDAPGMVLANNTVWDTTSGIVIADTPAVAAATEKVRAFNNIVDKLSAEPVFFAFEDYNLVGTGLRQGSHDLAGRPRFKDAAGLDYRLLGASPAVDAGTSTDAPRADRLGQPRLDVPAVPNTGGGEEPYFDLGSFEFGGT
jgi:hypothetical protein